MNIEKRKIQCLYVMAAFAFFASFPLFSMSQEFLIFVLAPFSLIILILIFGVTIFPVALSQSKYTYKNRIGCGVIIALLTLMILLFLDYYNNPDAFGVGYSLGVYLGYLTASFLFFYAFGNYISRIHIGILLASVTVELGILTYVFLPTFFM